MKSRPNVLFKVFTISIFIFVFINCTNAQNDSLIVGRKYTITLLNHFEMTGIVKSITPDTVKIKTDIKTFNVPRKDIATVLDLEKEETGSIDDSTRVIFEPDPSESRLFIGTTGKTLKAGHGYVSTALLFPWITVLVFPFGNVGITDYINFGAGASFYPPLFYFAPKVRALHTKNIDVSIGLAYAHYCDFQKIKGNDNLGLLYGTSSFSFDKVTCTVGAGVSYRINWEYDKGIDISPYPLFMLGFEHREFKETKIISENWLSFGSKGGYIAILSMGPRFILDDLAIDACVIGIWTNFSFDGGSRHKSYFFPVLWGSIAYNFEL